MFDTIAFYEVTSRLARARGALNMLSGRVDDITDPSLKHEIKRLLRITQDATIELEKLEVVLF